MSTQSGITASKDLLDTFKDLNEGALVIRVSEDNTELNVDKLFENNAKDGEDLLDSLQKYISNDYPNPAYLIISLKGESDSSNGFTFISFIPDLAPIRLKMLYASTKNTLLNELGTNHFHKSRVFAFTDIDEISSESLSNSEPEAPLSKDEKLLEQVNSLQGLTLAETTGSYQSPSYKKKLASMHDNSVSLGASLTFNVDLLLEDTLKEIADENSIDSLVVIEINKDEEKFCLVGVKKDIAREQLVSTFQQFIESSDVHPYFGIYIYASLKAAYIYCCPSGSKVRDRMIYASNKQGLSIQIAKTFGSKIAIKHVMEVGDLEELELSELNDNITSSNENLGLKSDRKFNKPKGPRRR